MKIGSVGTSNITEMFLSAVKHVENMEHTAVYSRNRSTAERFAEKTGAEHIFTDPADMAKSGTIDAVYIASPNRFHFEQSKLFLTHGIHVFCEKPLTTTKAQEEELIALAEAKGLIYTKRSCRSTLGRSGC